MIGETVAHYRITSKLSEGGMGGVYRATVAKLNHSPSSAAPDGWSSTRKQAPPGSAATDNGR